MTRHDEVAQHGGKKIDKQKKAAGVYPTRAERRLSDSMFRAFMRGETKPGRKAL